MTTLFSATILVGFILSHTLSGCTTEQAGDLGSGDINADASLSIERQRDHTHDAKEEVVDTARIYSQAIGDYIRLVHKEYELTFDTLLFGKHHNGKPEDLPNIEFPSFIDNTTIKIISPEQGVKNQKERPSSIYINLMGWVDPGKADFIFVTFSEGMAHQFDCFIAYEYDHGTKEFVMEATRFENYRYKPKR